MHTHLTNKVPNLLQIWPFRWRMRHISLHREKRRRDEEKTNKVSFVSSEVSFLNCQRRWKTEISFICIQHTRDRERESRRSSLIWKKEDSRDNFLPASHRHWKFDYLSHAAFHLSPNDKDRFFPEYTLQYYKKLQNYTLLPLPFPKYEIYPLLT